MLFSYSIISSLILGFGYLGYRLVMYGERQHAFNRAFILGIYAFALLLPIVMLEWLPAHSSPVAGLTQIEFGELTPEGVAGETAGEAAKPSILHAINLGKVIIALYLTGVAAVVLYTLIGIVALWRIIRSGERIEEDGYTLILVEPGKISPFSWRKTIVMSRSDYEETGEMILLHECAHLRLGHWADLVLARLVAAIQWYNPAAWVMMEELKAIHEYQADEEVISSGVEIKQYQLLLIKKAVGSRFQSLANSLNHSKLKKRVTMMYKKQTSMGRRLAALIVIPAMAAGCAVAAIPAVADVIETFAASTAASSVTPASVTPEAPAAPQEQQENERTTKADSKGREVYISVDESPEYPGGTKALMQFLAENMRYPEEAFKKDEQGRVIVRFVVETDGSIGDVEVIKKVTPLLDEEAIRVVKGMPAWIPGKVKGKAVACWFNLPVSFKIKSDAPAKEEAKTAE